MYTIDPTRGFCIGSTIAAAVGRRGGHDLAMIKENASRTLQNVKERDDMAKGAKTNS